MMYLRILGSTALLVLLSMKVDARTGGLCDREATTTCGADRLPRITHCDWNEANIRQFRERATHGTVAVAIPMASEKGKPRLLTDCKLPGSYAEIKTQSDDGHLWITNRALLVIDEIASPGCSEATHEVAAYAITAVLAKATKPVGSASPTAPHFSALLVPVPCPSVDDPSKARGCLARGSTGAQRRVQARALIDTLGRDAKSKVDLADSLAVYAMAADDFRVEQYLARASTWTECSMNQQISWVLSQYRSLPADENGERRVRVIPPDAHDRQVDPLAFFVDLSDENCRYQPPFRKCFPDIARASPGYNGCWDYAHSAIPPREPAQPIPATPPSKPAPAAAPAAGCAPAPSPTTPKKVPAP